MEHRTVWTVILQAARQRLRLSRACRASRLLCLLVLFSGGEPKGYASSVSLQAHNPKARVEKVKCVNGVTDQGMNFTSQCARKGTWFWLPTSRSVWFQSFCFWEVSWPSETASYEQLEVNLLGQLLVKTKQRRHAKRIGLSAKSWQWKTPAYLPICWLAVPNAQIMVCSKVRRYKPIAVIRHILSSSVPFLSPEMSKF